MGHRIWCECRRSGVSASGVSASGVSEENWCCEGNVV